MKNTKNMKNYQMRKLPFSCSTPRYDPTMNIEPKTASKLFDHTLHSIYACIVTKLTPELFIFIPSARYTVGTTSKHGRLPITKHKTQRKLHLMTWIHRILLSLCISCIYIAQS